MARNELVPSDTGVHLTPNGFNRAMGATKESKRTYAVAEDRLDRLIESMSGLNDAQRAALGATGKLRLLGAIPLANGIDVDTEVALALIESAVVDRDISAIKLYLDRRDGAVTQPVKFEFDLTKLSDDELDFLIGIRKRFDSGAPSSGTGASEPNPSAQTFTMPAV